MLAYIVKQSDCVYLFNSLDHYHPNYIDQFCCLTYRIDVNCKERVKAKATELVSILRNKTLEDYFKGLNIFSLESLRLLDQLIELFQILYELYSLDYSSIFYLSKEEGRRNHK